MLVCPGAKTIKKNTNSTQNKYQTHNARAYEVTSFLSTDCELSTETCSRFVYSLGPWCCSQTDDLGAIATSHITACQKMVPSQKYPALHSYAINLEVQ